MWVWNETQSFSHKFESQTCFFLFGFSYIKRKSVKTLFVAGVYYPSLFKTLRRLKLICRTGALPSALLYPLCLQLSFLSASGQNSCWCHCQWGVCPPQNTTWEINRVEKLRASLPLGADKHLAPCAAQWLSLKWSMHHTGCERRSWWLFSSCCDRILCCVLIPWVSHYQGAVLRNGFRVDLIDRNRLNRRGAVGGCFDMQQMCGHKLHVNELWDDSGGGGAPHSLWFLWVSVKHLGSMLFVLEVWHQNKNPQIPVAFVLERCFFPRILWADQGYGADCCWQRRDFTSQPKQLGNVFWLWF